MKILWALSFLLPTNLIGLQHSLYKLHTRGSNEMLFPKKEENLYLQNLSKWFMYFNRALYSLQAIQHFWSIQYQDFWSI